MLTENHRDLISIFFTITIIALTALVAGEFFLPLTWAGILAIATWPLYKPWHQLLKGNSILAASSLTLLFIILVVLPLTWITFVLGKEIQLLSKFLITANTQGAPVPAWLNNIPYVHTYLIDMWQNTLGRPHGVGEFVSSSTATSLTTVTAILKQVGAQIAHRSVVFGFSILCLFFFYKDGYALQQQINAIGKYCMGERWQRYAITLPISVKATVNGLVLIGLAVGLIMGVSYAIVGLPAPTLLGLITAILAMIPFGAPIIFILVCLVLAAQGNMVSAIVILSFGTLLMFIVDHFVRPFVIGGATRLPFLAVLFGILGGVKTMGIIGLFIGPVIMVLFVTLWHEPELFNERVS